MDLFEKVSKDIVAAMKAKDKVRLEALRNIKKYFIEAKTQPGANDTLTDEAASADLLLTDHAPGGSLLDVTSDTLLAAAAARADQQASGPFYKPQGQKKEIYCACGDCSDCRCCRVEDADQ